MVGVVLALLVFGDLPKAEQGKVDALRALGADVRVERGEDGRLEVWVDYNKPATDGQLEHLSGFTSLTALRILDGRISDAGLRHLKGVPRVWLVVIKSPELTDRACTHLAKLPALSKLDLMGAKLSPQGIGSLGRVPTLRQLYLHGARLEGQVAVPLAKMTWLKNLSLPKNFSAKAVEELKKALPTTQISLY